MRQKVEKVEVYLLMQIYFKYEEVTRLYVYREQTTEYKMPLALMLKFKKFSRAQDLSKPTGIQGWLQTLTTAELHDINILQKTAIH